MRSLFAEKEKRIHFAVLVVITLSVTLISMYFRVSLLASILLAFGLPAVYLSYLAPEHIKKTLIFSLVLGIAAAIIIDSIAEISQVWATTSIFTFKLFDIISIEMFVWSILFLYLTVIFYEYFFDRVLNVKTGNRYIYLLVLIFLFFAIVIPSLVINKEFLNRDYLYILGGVLLYLIPIGLFARFYPKLLVRFFKAQIYFTLVAFAHELTALYLGHWIFPGDSYIGGIGVLGQFLPFEEIFLFFLLGSVGVLTYYEFFADDRR